MGGKLPLGTTFPRGFQRESIKWDLVPASELFELKYGKALVEANRCPGKIPVFGTNGPCGTHNQALFRGPGVVLGRKGQGPLGVEWVDGDYWVIDTAYSLTPIRPGVDLRFAYFLIKYIGLNHLKDGTSNPSLNRETFGAQALPLPPLSDQVAIASILAAFDNKIDLNRRMNETLEAMARAIFKDWFIDFGPTRAKMEGREPYLAPELWALFPDRLDDEGNPEGWEISTIGKEVEAVGGSTPSTKEPSFWDGDIHWATPKDLSSLVAPVLLDTGRKITKAGLAQISSGLLPAGIVLLSSRAPIGYLAITEVPLAINQGFIAMHCQKRLTNVFVWLWTAANMEAILQNANGSTFQEISKRNFRPLAVIVPSSKLLKYFDDVVRPIYDRIAANDHESRTLAQTRDLLLPKLMSGEIRVKEAEKIIEEVN